MSDEEVYQRLVLSQSIINVGTDSKMQAGCLKKLCFNEFGVL